jgi:hypothetical protein
MRQATHLHRDPTRLTSYFQGGSVMRSRSVSDIVLSAVLDVPAPSGRLMADWEREISARLGLEPGDVEPLPLTRARARWPDYKYCVQAASDWTRAIGLEEVIATSDIALMACRGARYKGLDVHFPVSGHRIPLVRGTVLVFDTGQPHAVIRRDRGGFNAADFASDLDCTQVFLTWELPIENIDVARALGVDFDIEPSIASRLEEEQVWWNDAPMSVCPESGTCQLPMGVGGAHGK